MIYRCPEGCEHDFGWSNPPSCCKPHGAHWAYTKALGTKPAREGKRPTPHLKQGKGEKRVPYSLTQGFADGVDERTAEMALGELGAYDCWLAQFDAEERPCDFKLERFHFIGRQGVGHGLWEQLRHMQIDGEPTMPSERNGIVQLAEWDPRNGGIGCEGHHRRFDSHMTPRIEVPALSLPSHVLGFIEDYGLEAEAERKFPGYGRLTIERVVA